MLQSDFVIQTIHCLEGMHCAIETSGYCKPEIFQTVAASLDYIIMDLKHMDNAMHIKYTGVSNAPILKNLEWLKQSGKPFRIRIPVIPGVNDSDENFEATANQLENCSSLEFVELLPYHKTAGAKYEMVGLAYSPSFQTDQAPNLNTTRFIQHGIPCKSL